MSGTVRRVLAGAVFAVATGCDGRRADPAADLATRARAYLALQERVAAGLPPLASSPVREAIAARERALASGLAASGEVRHGVLFTDEIAAEIRRRLASLLQGTAGRNVRGAILDADPAGTRVAVGARYPSAAPLSTVPTAVLEVLPPLPEALEYRFVGHDLIVRDVDANLVVDVLGDAFP